MFHDNAVLAAVEILFDLDVPDEYLPAVLSEQVRYLSGSSVDDDTIILH